MFAVALAVRLCFWQATADREWPGSAAYAGDAGTWVAHAAALAGAPVPAGGGGAAEPFELDLPLRPPGNAWLLALAGGGEVATGKLVWSLLGALVPLLVYRAALGGFGLGVALGVGLVTAGSTALLVLSASLNNETPYLVLATASIAAWRPLRDRPTAAKAAGWGALHAAATLVRAEHALFAVATTAALAAAWRSGEPSLAAEAHAAERGARRTGRGATVGRSRRRPAALAAAAAGAYLVVLAPWHLAAWGAIERWSTVPPDTPVERAQQRLAAELSAIPWQPAAAAERERWPAFARATAANFVTATVAWRGGRRVTEADLAILDQGLGARPEPLPARPFVALYGGLNFWLANHAGADGGFSRGPLAAPPPLAGGAGSYPPALVAGLPPDDLALAYPPHAAAVRRGWGRGIGWIVAHPGDWARLVAAKLGRFWAGAALGLTGHGLPLGLSGVRWPVDLAVPVGGAATAWRLAVLLAAAAGAVLARPRRELVPWLLLLVAQAAVAAAFFGYARLGATAAPVVALLVTLAVARLLPAVAPRRALAIAAACGALLVAVEAGRALSGPALRLDGRPIGRVPPPAAAGHGEMRLDVGGRAG